MSNIFQILTELGSNNIVKCIGWNFSVIGLAYILLKNFKIYRGSKKRKSYPKNVVVLHQFPRGMRAPSNSPYCLKLETWLRMANIEYIHSLGYVTSAFYNASFTSKENATAHAIQKMNEESLPWVIGSEKYFFYSDENDTGVPNFVVRLLAGRVRKALYYQGYGRHSREELYKIGKNDLKAINDIIGNENKFLLGKTVCNEDASVFGMLCQIVYHSRGELYQYTKTECPNILRYVNTIKSEFWKDWDQNTNPDVLKTSKLAVLKFFF